MRFIELVLVVLIAGVGTIQAAHEEAQKCLKLAEELAEKLTIPMEVSTFTQDLIEKSRETENDNPLKGMEAVKGELEAPKECQEYLNSVTALGYDTKHCKSWLTEPMIIFLFEIDQSPAAHLIRSTLACNVYNWGPQ